MAPNPPLRAAVVAIGCGAPAADAPADAPEADDASPAATQAATPSGSSVPSHPLRPTKPPPERAPPFRLAWALLLARIYEVLPLLCPACGGPMRIIAFLTEPAVVRRVLLHLGLPERPPPVAPARGPPQAELAFDQTPGYAPTDGDPGRGFEFDQSLPEELEL